MTCEGCHRWKYLELDPWSFFGNHQGLAEKCHVGRSWGEFTRGCSEKGLWFNRFQLGGVECLKNLESSEVQKLS